MLRLVRRLRFRRGEKHRLFLALDVRAVLVHDALRGRLPGLALLTMVEPDGVVAKPLDKAERMRHEQDGLAAPLEFRKFVEALMRETLVADGEHFVDQQHIRIHVDRGGKPKPMLMPDE